ncbi:MAG: LPS export ABC transporter permease LptF [Proteobacteria bacterium]|nr:LPS export ABC transporter permease LptF [Pseudomonadota bacterium]
MLSRLDRYLLREVTVTFVAVTGVLLIVLLSNQFARVLGQAAASGFPASIVLTLIGLTTLQQLTVLVPIGLFLGIVLALGRLYHESEMTAMTACGVGPLRIYRPIALLAVVVVALLAVLSYRIVPAAWIKSNDLRLEATRAAQFGALEPGRFRSFAGGDAVFYAERVEKTGELYGVFVQRSVGDKIEIAMAERAVQRGAGQPEQMFILYDGRRYEGVPGTPNWRIVEFREHGIPVRLPEAKAGKNKIEMMGTATLMASNNPKDRAELAWRTAVPVMALVLMVLAVPLARLRPRQGRFARVGYAVLAYFLYSNLLAAVRVWIQKDSPGGQLGLWWVHLVPLALAVWLLWSELHPGKPWRMPWRRRRASAAAAG